jgi:hypothetical protein
MLISIGRGVMTKPHFGAYGSHNITSARFLAGLTRRARGPFHLPMQPDRDHRRLKSEVCHGHLILSFASEKIGFVGEMCEGYQRRILKDLLAYVEDA